jgi:hypothetical protein
MNLGLDDDEHTALVELLLAEVEGGRFPRYHRGSSCCAILAKLGIGRSPAMPYPAPKPSAVPSMALAKKRRR